MHVYLVYRNGVVESIHKTLESAKLVARNTDFIIRRVVNNYTTKQICGEKSES